jgi:hypothetical protein
MSDELVFGEPGWPGPLALAGVVSGKTGGMKRLLGEPGATELPEPGALLPALAEPVLGEPAFDVPALGNALSAVADGSRLNDEEDSALEPVLLGLDETPPASEDQGCNPELSNDPKSVAPEWDGVNEAKSEASGSGKRSAAVKEAQESEDAEVGGRPSVGAGAGSGDPRSTLLDSRTALSFVSWDGFENRSAGEKLSDVGECQEASASADEWSAAKEVMDKAAREEASGFGPASEVGDSRLSNMSRRSWTGLRERQLH